MHFQVPPYDHAKVVYCCSGSVLDAIVDLRGDSNNFGIHETFQLSDQNGQILYIAPGVAHGFYVESSEAILVYNVTVEFKPDADSGVRWNSCGISWPVDSPIVSVRDANLPPLEDAKGLFSLKVNLG